ncbi:unnamed protein product [Miscanthus lutarioriparius]|uniref:Uncharacterized protein n=1 Tax=Miscanthus lutarioriparius TaxID=422564 RepID=A0A811MJ94_9POAL|nr:unnamed protein product [Miscanthus lutarioriparius]
MPLVGVRDGAGDRGLAGPIVLRAPVEPLRPPDLSWFQHQTNWMTRVAAARPPSTPCPDSAALGSGTPPPDFAAVLGLRHRPPPPATASSGGTGGADDASSDGTGDTGSGGAGFGGGHRAGEDEAKQPRRASLRGGAVEGLGDVNETIKKSKNEWDPPINNR